jgi:uncharacterized paraquat-inducible protein A
LSPAASLVPLYVIIKPRMPIRTKIECPKCDALLVTKRGGVCPNCGAPITEHVARVRARERRIEQVVAIVASALVLALFLATTGIGLVEGLAVYAGVGAIVFFLARRTFI